MQLRDLIIGRLETLRLSVANRPKFGLGQYEMNYYQGHDTAVDAEIEFLEDALRDTSGKEFKGYE